MFGGPSGENDPPPRPYVLSEQYIEVNGAKMCYVEKGEGQSLLMIHGLMGGVYTWEDNLEALSGKFHVIAIDLPGFGKSQKGDLPYSIVYFKEVIHDFILKKKLEKPIIVGISLGGHLGISYALDHPENVGGLIIVGSTGGGREFTWYEGILVDVLWSDFLVGLYTKEENLKRYWDRQFSEITPKTEKRFLSHPHFRDGTKAHHDYVHTFSVTLRDVLRDNLKEEYYRVSAPSLILWGKKDYYHHIEDAYLMDEKMPNSELKVFPNAGHTIMQEIPDKFNQTVVDFSEKIASSKN